VRRVCPADIALLRVDSVFGFGPDDHYRYSAITALVTLFLALAVLHLGSTKLDGFLGGVLLCFAFGAFERAILWRQQWRDKEQQRAVDETVNTWRS